MSFSVLMSVYSNENAFFLNEALTSIWDNQTLRPGQIVMVQDGPLTNDLLSVLSHWKEKLRDAFVIVCLPHNVGLGAALNEGLKCCSYDLVARMDTDDISMPYRFEKQVEFMRLHPEIVASSSIIEEWNYSMSSFIGRRNVPLKFDEIVKVARRRSPLSHPVAIFRKSVVINVGGYPELRKAQDYALWSLLLVNNYCLANLPDILLRMRTGKELLSRRGREYFKYEFQLLKFQKKIGFLSARDYCINIIIRFVLRVLPGSLKVLAYKLIR